MAKQVANGKSVPDLVRFSSRVSPATRRRRLLMMPQEALGWPSRKPAAKGLAKVKTN